MNIHEYQANELMNQFGVANPKGGVASTPEEAESIARSLGTNSLVIKSQIHAGGRGKGTFKSGLKGGVHFAKTANQARDITAQMLGQTLVTVQTGPQGRVVRKVLVTETVDIRRELYFAIIMDRALSAPVVIASTEGGMEIETVAEKSPEKIIRERIDPSLGIQPWQTRKLAKKLGFAPKDMRPACRLFAALYKLFSKCDCSMVEVNPLVETKGGDVLALDAKFNFDENALFRQPNIQKMRDPEEEDPREVEAAKFNLNYIGLSGNIGCMVNGAGLAMATMDIIKHCGGEPANFLDVGGGASEAQVTEAFKILVADPSVKAILVNIFGGIMRCDVLAQGVINAYRSLEHREERLVPLVVRLEGTNVDQGKELLRASGLPLATADDLADAARKVVEAAKATA
jgi:succinyl-CoA synthetase beta subunit